MPAKWLDSVIFGVMQGYECGVRTPTESWYQRRLLPDIGISILVLGVRSRYGRGDNG